MRRESGGEQRLAFAIVAGLAIEADGAWSVGALQG